MTTAGIRIGDVIKCDVKGRHFYALVISKDPGQPLGIKPITHNTSYFSVTPGQVIEHYRKSQQGPRRRRRAHEQQEGARS